MPAIYQALVLAVVAIVAGLAAAIAAAAVTPPPAIKSAGKIVFCTDPTYPPEESLQGTRYVGSDIDWITKPPSAHPFSTCPAPSKFKQGQDVVFNSLQQRFNESAGVNIDEEMANLLGLQNAYAANARVLSAVKDMLEALIHI